MRPSFLDDMAWSMAEVYGAVTDRILINLAKYFPMISQGGEVLDDFNYQAKMLAQMGQVNRETIAIIAQSLGGADEALKGTIEAAIIEALKKEEPQLRKAAEAGLLRGAVEVSPNQLQAFRAYYQQAADKLNLVNTVMLESTQAAYTATVADVAQRIQRSQSYLNIAAGEVVTGVSSYNSAMHDAVQKMVKNGLTGFIDHGGHRWSPEAYVAMDIRTTLFNTSRAAIWERNQQYGNDLYQVSTHNGARPLCYPWQGKVISTSGRTGMTEDLDGNKIAIHAESEIESFRYGGGLFGINCGHYPMTFIPGFSTIKGEPQDPEENAKTYAESQQQRALERKLREEKRDLEVMKAQGASPEEIKAQRERVRNADADIDQFCQDTGRARRKDREKAPVRAEWPDAGGNVTRYNGGYIGTDVVPPPKGPVTTIPQPTPTPPTPSTPTSTPPIPIPVPQNVAPQATQQTPRIVTIADAQNKEELFEAVAKEYPVSISDNIKKLDFDMTKQAFIGIKKVTDNYPEIGNSLKNVITIDRGVMACGGNRISFNPEYFEKQGKLQNSITRCTNNGWWPKNTTISSLGTHEAAHAIEFYLDMNSPSYSNFAERMIAWRDCTEAKAIVSEACKAVKNTEHGKGMLNKQLIKEISEYATSNASEALAESYADVYINGTNASPLAQKIVELTTERYKQYGGTGNGH